MNHLDQFIAERQEDIKSSVWFSMLDPTDKISALQTIAHIVKATLAWAEKGEIKQLSYEQDESHDCIIKKINEIIDAVNRLKK